MNDESMIKRLTKSIDYVLELSIADMDDERYVEVFKHLRSAIQILKEE